MPLVGLAVRIHHDLTRQARLDVLKLRLLEVRRDPEVANIERDDLHHLLAGLHVLSNLDSAVADDSADWRNLLRVLEVQLSLVQFGLPAIGIGLRGKGAGAGGSPRLRGALAGG